MEESGYEEVEDYDVLDSKLTALEQVEAELEEDEAENQAEKVEN